MTQTKKQKVINFLWTSTVLAVILIPPYFLAFILSGSPAAATGVLCGLTKIEWIVPEGVSKVKLQIWDSKTKAVYEPPEDTYNLSVKEGQFYKFSAD